MKIITVKKEAEKLLFGHKVSILDSFGYKKILNDFYNPDKYLFFKKNHEIVPLVIKNNLVTFYGGTQHNHYNSFDIENDFLNEVLDYLTQHKYTYRLLSLTKDYFSGLNSEYEQYDVPYPVTWIYENINNFTLDSFLEKYPSKKKNKMKNVLNHGEDYIFENLKFEDFIYNYQFILNLHKQYFKDRQILSVWQYNQDLLLKILQYFEVNENIMIRICKHESLLVGIYIIVYNENELIHYFGSSLDFKDQYISKLIYFDLLKNANLIAKKLSINYIDALPGGYSNKKRFKFTPKPLYALVHDDNWVIKRDIHLTDKEYISIYQRDFGAEIKANKYERLI